MFADTISITVNAVQRDHIKAWDADFADAIAKGNTSIRKCSITNGESLVRTSHSRQGEKARHVHQLVETVQDAGGVTRVRKIHVVIEHDDTAAERSATKLLSTGFVASLDSATLDNVIGDSL